MGRGLASCVNVLNIQGKIGAQKTYLLFNHAVSGCDSVSVLFEKSKKTVLRKVKESLGEICCLSVRVCVRVWPKSDFFTCRYINSPLV